MLKQKNYDIGDTNLANFGSELEKNVKTAAALSDPEWNELANSEPEVGLKIWRIEKFAVKKLPKEEYGEFFSGDSYILINTYKKEEKFQFDIHFWLGAETTQDEAGTAAYKTVELDDVLKGSPVQHREVEGHESHLFLKYFKKIGGIRILEGGIESGFTHVEAETYRPRLLWIKGKKVIRVVEVELSGKSLNSGDVFILDNGLELYQWQGEKSGGMERMKAGILARAIDDERRGQAEVYVISQGDTDSHSEEFWKLLGGKTDIHGPEVGGGDDEWDKDGKHILWRINDEGGITFEKEAEGEIKRSMLHSSDCFLLDVGNELFVWIGKDSSAEERKHGMLFAQEYIHKNGKPVWMPLSRILEGGENEVFTSYLAGEGRNF